MLPEVLRLLERDRHRRKLKGERCLEVLHVSLLQPSRIGFAFLNQSPPTRVREMVAGNGDIDVVTSEAEARRAGQSRACSCPHYRFLSHRPPSHRASRGRDRTPETGRGITHVYRTWRRRTRKECVNRTPRSARGSTDSPGAREGKTTQAQRPAQWNPGKPGVGHEPNGGPVRAHRRNSGLPGPNSSRRASGKHGERDRE